MIPDVPQAGGKGPIGFGDLKIDGSDHGFRFLVMEQMESSFQSIISDLFYNNNASSGIEIGPIAVRLIRLMEAIHSTHNVFVDVKPENLMIAEVPSANSSSTSKKSKSDCTSMAARIRMIDLGLMESSRDVMKNKHRVDQYPDAQLVGTPVYASMNVLSGHTVSRRDDLEACLYIMIELILQIQHYHENSGGVVSDNLLSWSTAKSDDDIKRLKEEAMDLDHGTIWSLIGRDGNQTLSDGMKEVFGVVTSLDFKEKPEYDGLARRVSKWKVRLNPASASASASTTSKARAKSNKAATQTTKRKVRDGATSSKASKPEPQSSPSSPPSYDEDVPPTPVIAGSSSRAARAAARAASRESPSAKKEDIEIINDDSDKIEIIDDDSDSDMEMISASGEETQEQGNCASAHEESEDLMDWEIITDENEPLNTANNKEATKANTSTSTPSLLLECIDGPHRGESVDLIGTLVIGSNPGKKTGKSQVYSIGKDGEASPKHTKLVLNTSGSKKNGVLMVKVFDLKSDAGTLVNNKMLPKGSSRQAFVKDRIQVGESVFRILKK